MSDKKTGDLNIDEYLAGQASDIAAKHVPKKPKFYNRPGQTGILDTGAYGVTVVNNNAAFEMKGKGAADVRLTGPRPQRPDKITQEEKKEV
jgi:hypothetical protein